MRYLNILKNQWLISRAWMMTSFIFMFCTIFLVAKLGQSSLDVPVRLIPYDYAANNGYVTVKSDGFGDADNYLVDIAAADIQNYTNWNNRTVVNQYSRFVNRMSPALYNKQGRLLLETAKSKKDTEEAQTFFVERTSISKDKSKVSISGTLTMYQGTVVTRKLNMNYVLSYNSKNGLPKISNFKAEVVEK